MVLGLGLAPFAQALDLSQTWQATLAHDPQIAVSQAARLAGTAKKQQAAALWRPSLVLSASAGATSADSTTTGANFSATGFPTSNGVEFNTSVTNGSSTRWTLGAKQPLLSAERSAQSKQLDIAASVSELEWESAQADLLLRTAQRYFDLLLATRKLEVLRQQQKSVDQAWVEAKDRFALGDKPVTDTHEALARSMVLQAQVLAAHNDLEMAQIVLAHATGLSLSELQPMEPPAVVQFAEQNALESVIAQALANNPLLRMQAAQVQVAQQEVAKFSALGSATLDVVAQSGQDRLSGSGDFGSASNTSNQRMLGLQWTLPIYTGGYRSARQEEALRLEDKARAELERSRQQISQQTRGTWLALQYGTARLAALNAAHQDADGSNSTYRLKSVRLAPGALPPGIVS
jgi:outer membrane protein